MFLDSTWGKKIVEKWGVGVPEIDISLVTESPLKWVNQIRARRTRIWGSCLYYFRPTSL
jgi:hypothetical protein